MLKEKIALVTGASRGIGRSIAIELLESGVNVGVGFRENYDLAKEICSHGNGIPVKIEIEEISSINDALLKVKDTWGTAVEILVNNAAISQEKPFETITVEDWDRMLAVNLRAPFWLSKQIIPEMQKKRWGRIINMVSIGGQWGGFNQVHYAASKAALINLTRSLARIYSQFGITINAISPGLVATDMIKAELQTEEGRKKVNSIPIGRIAKSEEIAKVVHFLCSDDASYITGQTINVNGGMYFG